MSPLSSTEDGFVGKSCKVAPNPAILGADVFLKWHPESPRPRVLFAEGSAGDSLRTKPGNHFLPSVLTMYQEKVDPQCWDS